MGDHDRPGISPRSGPRSRAAGIEVDEAEVTQLPSTTIPLDAENAPKVLRLVDALEDLDDVQAVYANFDISDEILADVG